jgi:hypothetical protein
VRLNKACSSNDVELRNWQNSAASAQFFLAILMTILEVPVFRVKLTSCATPG